MANNKFHFSKFKRFSSPWLSYKEKSDGKYIKSGDDNQFPEHLIELYNKSSIHAAAINATTEAIIGGGLKADDNFSLKRANKRGESWNTIYTKIATDYYLHGAFALEVIWSLDRSRIAEVYHIDFSHLRAKEKNDRGIIPGYYISNKWKSYSTQTDDIDYLPIYDPNKAQEETNQIFVSTKYRPGQEYYPLPVYNAALKVIELDTEVDTFHVSNIANGLAPSIAITTYTDGSDDDRKAIEEGLRANYGGADNAGALIYMDVASPDLKPDITPIPQNGADGYYTTINDMTTQKILTAHRITSPMMLGIKTEGQLGGRSEVIDAFLLWFNTVIEPMQQDILAELEILLQVNYPDIILGVESKQLYDDGTVEEDIVTSVETTVEDDQQINEQLETEVDND